MTLGVILTLFVTSMSVTPAHASEGVGEIGVSIIDPTTFIDVKQAREFCRREPQTVKCDILKETIKDKKQSSKDRKKREGKRRQQLTYKVLNANFE